MDAGSPRTLDELRALSDAATHGEWHAHGCEVTLGVRGHEPYTPGEPEFHCEAAGRIYDEGGHNADDAAFIVAAVNYVRARLNEGRDG